LNFTYENGGLRIDCNEIGFTAANVEAICGISQSTKVGASRSHFTGEKGIGFKSVFGVADVVWISSRGYSFKLDRTKRLGMITPAWAKFPADPIPGFTSFYLQIRAECDGYLTNRLRSLDSRLLIFLRRLRQMNLRVIHDGQIWAKKLSRTDKDEDGYVLTSLQDDDMCRQYIVFKHRIGHLPFEKRRLGCSESEIALAFPAIDHTQNPQLDSQKVYAFLPIRDFGFKVGESSQL
jgi:hypothetical protein